MMSYEDAILKRILSIFILPLQDQSVHGRLFFPPANPNESRDVLGAHPLFNCQESHEITMNFSNILTRGLGYFYS